MGKRWGTGGTGGAGRKGDGEEMEIGEGRIWRDGGGVRDEG